MATAEFSLIRAYLDWQSEMGSDEVVLPQPLTKRTPAFSASIGASSHVSVEGARSDADRYPAATDTDGAMATQPGQPVNGKSQPATPTVNRGAGDNAAAALFASLNQALNKTPDSRTGESAAGGPGRAGARGPDALNLPAFSDLEAFWDHLQRTPGLVAGDLNGGTSDPSFSPPGSKDPKDAVSRMIRGAGPVKAQLALVGFEPDDADVEANRPFQGEAGALLEKMMRAIRLDTNELYQTLLIKVRLSGKSWSRRELARIIPILHAELGLAQVPMVLLFGQECAQAVLKTGKTLDELRQETHRMEGREFFVTHHPAELLRKEELKRKTWEDLQWLQRRMAQGSGQART